VKVTILYDNETVREDLEPDWGFACLVEAEGAPRILFDTGGSGRILLANMERMGIDPSEVEEVFLSHGHFDHVGGLSALLDANPDVRVIAPGSFRGIRRAREVVYVGEPRMLHDGVFTTGELPGFEQSLLVRTDRGVAVVAGCAHPTVEEILSVASGTGRVYALLGGFHDFHDLDLLAGVEVLCPAHCTRAKEEILARFSDRCVRSGVGLVLEL
jgi:7,8-dihydropterin-6-yl-methyl-4-(beta-D-ribofuranosyl)aminobenzene 5'-phosphate synthase